MSNTHLLTREEQKQYQDEEKQGRSLVPIQSINISVLTLKIKIADFIFAIKSQIISPYFTRKRMMGPIDELDNLGPYRSREGSESYEFRTFEKDEVDIKQQITYVEHLFGIGKLNSPSKDPIPENITQAARLCLDLIKICLKLHSRVDNFEWQVPSLPCDKFAPENTAALTTWVEMVSKLNYAKIPVKPPVMEKWDETTSKVTEFDLEETPSCTLRPRIRNGMILGGVGTTLAGLAVAIAYSPALMALFGKLCIQYGVYWTTSGVIVSAAAIPAAGTAVGGSLGAVTERVCPPRTDTAAIHKKLGGKGNLGSINDPEGSTEVVIHSQTNLMISPSGKIKPENGLDSRENKSKNRFCC